ncbi:unnamed protein product [Vicia faba]|uniref:Uncharacterized protein n=1 Tax=Vicia faba TaxID=3906 RepID=A0AAV0ZV11_VICFA|nr:unnamed protein product [Vicia faba]
MQDWILKTQTLKLFLRPLLHNFYLSMKAFTPQMRLSKEKSTIFKHQSSSKVMRQLCFMRRCVEVEGLIKGAMVEMMEIDILLFAYLILFHALHLKNILLFCFM